MALTYSHVTGFEESLASAWDTVTGAAAVRDTTPADRHDPATAACLKVSGLSSGAASGVYKQSNTAGGTLSWSFYLKVGTAPSADNTVFYSGTGLGTISTRVTLGSDLVLRMYSDTNALIGTASSAIPGDGAYHAIQVQTVIGGSDTWDVWVDGTNVITGVATSASTGTGFFLGGNGNSEAQTAGVWYFDDVVMGSGTPIPATPWAVFNQYPLTAGDFDEGTHTGDTTGVACVDDGATPDDATTFHTLVTQSSSSTTADRLDVGVSSFSPGASSILCLQVNGRFRPASNASMNVILRYKTQAAGTLTESAAVGITGTAWVTNDDTLPAAAKLTVTTDPQGGGALTVALLNAAQVGVRSTDTTPSPQITSLWVPVLYVPSSLTPAVQPNYSKFPRAFLRTPQGGIAHA